MKLFEELQKQNNSIELMLDNSCPIGKSSGRILYFGVYNKHIHWNRLWILMLVYRLFKNNFNFGCFLIPSAQDIQLLPWLTQFRTLSQFNTP